eukprot:m.1475850 g.1475850  ORF g.1475850 m.1475850 type:complete len:419 (-) comp25156_c0_seq6:211-1467(-)
MLSHLVDIRIKEKCRVLRSASGLGVELHAEEGFRFVSATFVASVVGIRKQRFPAFGECISVDGISVVLRCNVAATIFEINARNVLPAVTKHHLFGFRTRRNRHQLMSHANAKDRLVALQRDLQVFDGWSGHRWIPRTVAVEETVARFLVDVVVPRHHLNVSATFDKFTNDVHLDATVHGHNVNVTTARRRVHHGRRPGHLSNEVAKIGVLKRNVVDRAWHDLSQQRSMLANCFCQFPCVNSRNTRNTLLFHPFREGLRGLKVCVVLTVFLADQSTHVNFVRFKIFDEPILIDRLVIGRSKIPNQGVRCSQNLPLVAGVRDGFGIRRHGRVEYNFSGTSIDGTKAVAMEDASIFQFQPSRSSFLRVQRALLQREESWYRSSCHVVHRNRGKRNDLASGNMEKPSASLTDHREFEFGMGE